MSSYTKDDDYDLTNGMNRAARYYKRDSDLSTQINDGAYSLVAYRVYSLFLIVCNVAL